MNKQTLLLVISFLLIAAAVIIASRGGDSSSSRGVYFYDLDDAKLYVAPPGTLAPTTAPSGGEGVAAAVFSCTTCEDPGARFTAYLTKHTDDYKKVLMSGAEPTAEQMAGGQLVRNVDGEEWLVGSSPEALAITRAATERCTPAQKSVLCQP